MSRCDLSDVIAPLRAGFLVCPSGFSTKVGVRLHRVTGGLSFPSLAGSKARAVLVADSIH